MITAEKDEQISRNNNLEYVSDEVAAPPTLRTSDCEILFCFKILHNNFTSSVNDCLKTHWRNTLTNKEAGMRTQIYINVCTCSSTACMALEPVQGNCERRRNFLVTMTVNQKLTMFLYLNLYLNVDVQVKNEVIEMHLKL